MRTAEATVTEPCVAASRGSYCRDPQCWNGGARVAKTSDPHRDGMYNISGSAEAMEKSNCGVVEPHFVLSFAAIQ